MWRDWWFDLRHRPNLWRKRTNRQPRNTHSFLYLFPCFALGFLHNLIGRDCGEGSLPNPLTEWQAIKNRSIFCTNEWHLNNTVIYLKWNEAIASLMYVLYAAVFTFFKNPLTLPQNPVFVDPKCGTLRHWALLYIFEIL